MQRCLFLCICVCLLSGSLLQAQVTTSQINGTITDPSGAVVPGVAVTVTSPDTGFSRTTQTNQAGAYSIPFLPPGRYNLKADAKGFASILQSNITLVLGQLVTLNFALKPGATGEVVEVTGEAPLIETGRSEIGGSVSPTEVRDLPIIDRNFAGLMTTIPGVRPAEAFDPTKTRSGNISINGSDGRAVDYNVDGGDNKDNVIGGLVQNFTMEGIQEFSVITNRYTAEGGRSVAGVVNVISKSGTNSFHGSAFGLFQTSSLFTTNALEAARCADEGRPADRCKAKYHRQQFGGSIGGPILKDKLFFFGAYEHKREPGSITANGTTNSELQTFANATSSFPGAPYAVPVSTLPFGYKDHLLTVKIDHKISDKQNMYYRYGRERWENPNDQLGSTSAPFTTDESQTNSDINQFHDFTIGHNYVISSSKTNSLNLHFQDFANTIGDAPGRTFTYPVSDGTSTTNPNIIFPSNAQVGINVNVPQQTLIRKYQIRDDFSWVHNKHTMKFGANWIYLAKLGGYFYSALGYTLTFWDDPTTITSSAAYPLGFSTPGAVQDISFSAGSGSTAQPPAHSIGLYFQDDYKVSRRLTLNLGLRWDANPNFLQPQLRDSLTNSNRAIWALRQTLLANPTAPAAQDGMAEIRQLVGDTSLLTKRTADWKEFQPRVGFAWDVTGSGNHVIRGGYGIARDQIFQNLTLWSIQQSQPSIYQVVLDQTSSVRPGGGACVGVLCTWQFGITPLPAPAGTIDDLAFGAVGRITNPHITDPWSQQMSIGWAWQIAPDYAFSVDYTHILGTHEERVLNANPRIRTICDPAYGGNTSDPRCVAGADTRLLDAAFQAANTCGPTLEGQECGAGRFAHIYNYSSNNRSLYDSINFQLRKRLSHRFTFQTSYVLSWSRSWGGYPIAAYLGSPLAVSPEQQFAPNEFNRTNNNERNRFVLSGVFTVPGGIELSPLFQAASGRPYSYLAGDDINGDGRSNIDRACVGSTLTNRIATLGCQMLPPNTLTGKPLIQMDLRTSKVVKLGERANMRISVEFFNLFNRANYCNDYQEDSSSADFNNPLGFCGGPSGSGYSAAAVPSFHTQAGIRFEF